MDLANEFSACTLQGLLGGNLAVGLHTKFDCCEERVWDLVRSEGDVWMMKELVTQEVAKGVVFLVQGEDACAGGA